MVGTYQLLAIGLCFAYVIHYLYCVVEEVKQFVKSKTVT